MQTTLPNSYQLRYYGRMIYEAEIVLLELNNIYALSFARRLVFLFIPAETKMMNSQTWAMERVIN